MIKKGEIGKDRKLKILIASIFLTACFDILFIGSSFQYANNQKSNPFHESAEPYYFTYRTNYTGPNILFPYANLDFAVANKYNGEISGFHFFLSFDNFSWVEIPLTKPLNIPSDPFQEQNYNLTNVGMIPLNGFSNVLYAKCIFPMQGFNDTTRTIIMNSFEGYLYIDPIWTPQSTATMILVSVALLSFIIQILDFWFKEKSSKTTNLKSAQQQKTN